MKIPNEKFTGSFPLDVEKDVDVINFVNTLDNNLGTIAAIKSEKDSISALCKTEFKNYIELKFAKTTYSEVKKDRRTGNIRLEKWNDHILHILLGPYTKFINKQDDYIARNIRDAMKIVRHIDLCSMVLEEAEEDFGTLEEFDDDITLKFYHEGHKNDFWLKLRAYELGADLIVSYDKHSHRGIPVKFKKRSD